MRKAGTNDFNSIYEMLKSENLPTEDIQPGLAHFFVIELEKKILAVIGLEIYGDEALLRSMAVDREYRNQSLATLLVQELIRYAGDNGVKSVYLITNTAEGYFARKGFSAIPRSETPLSITVTPEFTGLCPSTATVMRRKIEMGSIGLVK